MEKPEHNNDPELPPMFKTWRGLYIFVLVNLVVMITLFYLFTKYFE